MKAHDGSRFDHADERCARPRASAAAEHAAASAGCRPPRTGRTGGAERAVARTRGSVLLAVLCLGAALVVGCGPGVEETVVPRDASTQEGQLVACSRWREGRSCDDGNPCTFGDTCRRRVCAGTAYACDDGDVCTDEACDGRGACTYVANAAPCDDGDACTVNDRCVATSCGGVMPAEACANGLDDDCDGLADAADPDCAPACGNGVRDAGEACDGADLAGLACADLGYTDGTLSCSSGCTFDTGGCTWTCSGECACVDGDGDGWSGTGGSCGPADCDDTVPWRHPGAQEECDNGFDDECDGLVDGEDVLDCPACEVAERVCGDGLDGDCDMLPDALDPDCAPRCEPAPEIACGNGADDDCDGLADCNDPDCPRCSCEWDLCPPDQYCDVDGFCTRL